MRSMLDPNGKRQAMIVDTCLGDMPLPNATSSEETPPLLSLSLSVVTYMNPASTDLDSSGNYDVTRHSTRHITLPVVLTSGIYFDDLVDPDAHLFVHLGCLCLVSHLLYHINDEKKTSPLNGWKPRLASLEN